MFRYDYEKVDSAAADKMVERLNAFIADKTNVGKEFTAAGKTFKVAKAEDFEYTDPIDKSVSKKQVKRAYMKCYKLSDRLCDLTSDGSWSSRSKL